MRIKEIHIYGYGKLENYELTNLQDFQVLFGVNEAGKSTIMSFIHSVLFGFPSKQGQELRYEPKRNSKYGGRVKVEFQDSQLAVIERVKGKATGDVTVTLENGTIGGEELLKELLKGIDKHLFQAIFSFNIHGIQNVQSIKGEDLGRYLFSAGTLGSDRLFTIENQLQKEMELRFKPNGKRPIVNEKLKELKELRSSLKSVEQQNDRYMQLVKEKEEIEASISSIHEDLSGLEEQNSKLKNYRQNEQLIVEEANLIQNLSEANAVEFPLDGLRRLEQIQQELKPLKGRYTLLQEKSESLQKELEGCRPNEKLLEMETELESKVEALPLIDQMKQEKWNLDSKLEEVNEDISRIMDELHADYEEEELHLIDTSFYKKEQAESIQLESIRLKRKKEELDSSFEEEKILLIAIEEEVEKAKKQLMSEQQRAECEDRLRPQEMQIGYQIELGYVQEQISIQRQREKDEKQKRKRQKKRDFYQFVLTGTLFIILAIFGLLFSQHILTATGTIGCIILFLLFYKFSKEKSGQKEDSVLAQLIEREASLKIYFENTNDEEVNEWKKKLALDEELRDHYKQLKMKLNQQNDRYEKIILQFQKWEDASDENSIYGDKMITDLKLPSSISYEMIFDAFLLVEKLKQLFRERNRTEKRLEALSMTFMQMQESVSNLAHKFLGHSNGSIIELASLLKKELKKAHEQKAKHKELSAKREELNEEVFLLERNIGFLEEDVKNLYSLAKANHEDEFRKMAAEAEQVGKWKLRLKDIRHQLERAGLTELEKQSFRSAMSVEVQLEENISLQRQKKKSLSNHLEQIAKVEHEIHVLEQGGTYSEMLHQYKQLKCEFEEDAKEWARFAVAKDLLSKTIERYKEDRLPKMLALAEEYLSHLTKGMYTRIHPQKSGSGFLIERRDHLLFEANELSQATTEQVYVAIRLALASARSSQYPFPIVIDDSFVNFDRERTKRIIELLRRFNQNQILFFTCHHHVLEYFKQADVLHIGRKEEKVI